jgi:hypothetical protein
MNVCWVEVGRPFKYSLQGVRPQYCSSSPSNHCNLSGSRLHIQAPFHPRTPVSLGYVLLTSVGWEETTHTHTHLFSLRVCCKLVHILERIFKMPKEYKIQYTIIKLLSLPYMQHPLWLNKGTGSHHTNPSEPGNNTCIKIVAYATYMLKLLALSILSITDMVRGKLHPSLSLYMSPSRMRINAACIRLYVGSHTGVSCFYIWPQRETFGLVLRDTSILKLYTSSFFYHSVLFVHTPDIPFISTDILFMFSLQFFCFVSDWYSHKNDTIFAMEIGRKLHKEM